MQPPDNRQNGRNQRAVARALALPRRWQPALDLRLVDGRDFLARGIAREIEQRRLFPWLAVCFGSGILLFFQADGQPALWAPVSGMMIFTGLAAIFRGRIATLAVCIGLAMAFAGFAAGVVRSRSVEAPVLGRTVIAPLSGFIEAVEERPEGKRLLVRLTELKGTDAAARPRLVRVTLRKADGLVAGQYIAGKARLLPPPQPAWPGGYDFGRDAYFRGIGAVGSILGSVTPLDPPTRPPFSLRVAAAGDEARNVLTKRIATAIGGPAGGVGAALVTGKRGLIPEPTNDVLRAAGIYHIVSISGLHMVLAAGTFFWLARALLSLVPSLVLLWPVKKMAAVTAMLGATAYCVFSGSDVATVRSLIMSLVMFGAVLVDRPALSVRNLTISAIVVLAREPEALLGPSFQMSFGAVAALAAFVPALQGGRIEGRPASMLESGVRFAGRHAAGLVSTTLVASIGTAPFAAYHFQTLNPYGLVGNTLALPLVSLVVMPSAVLGVLSYPFGLDDPVWRMMGAAVSQVLDVSAWVGGFAGSSVVIPALSLGALALFSLALLLASIAASSLRWLALVPALAGLALAASPGRPDVYIDRAGQGAAIRNAAGRLTFVGKPSAFVAEQWLRADGDGRDAAAANAADTRLKDGARCDPQGCVVETANRRNIAFVQKFSAFEEDCHRAEIVISSLKAPRGCAALLVLDREALAARGATTIRLDAEGMDLRSVRKGDERLSRTPPSSRQPERPAKPAVAIPEQDIPEDDADRDAPERDAPERGASDDFSSAAPD